MNSKLKRRKDDLADLIKSVESLVPEGNVPPIIEAAMRAQIAQLIFDLKNELAGLEGRDSNSE